MIIRLKFNDIKNISFTNSEIKIENGGGVKSIQDSLYGNVAYFNGNNDSFINIHTSICDNSPRTISCWVKRLDSNPGIIYKNGYDTRRYSCYFGMGYKEFSLNYGTSNLIINGDFPIMRWFHIVSVYDGTILKVYIDGDLVESIEIDLNTGDNYFVLGKDPDLGGNLFMLNGYMLDFRIYNEYLSHEEISSIYLNGPNPFSINMYSNLALIEWNRVHNYRITITGNNGFISRKNVNDTYVIIYNLDEDESYKFEIYDLINNTYRYDTMKTPKLNNKETKNLIKLVSNDLTKIRRAKISAIAGFLRNNLNTNEKIKARVKNVIKDHKITFVQDSESICISKSPILLTPFLREGGSSQSLNVTFEDSSKETIKYDEIDNTINVKSKKYSVGDKFILGGKTVRVSELN